MAESPSLMTEPSSASLASGSRGCALSLTEGDRDELASPARLPMAESSRLLLSAMGREGAGHERGCEAEEVACGTYLAWAGGVTGLVWSGPSALRGGANVADIVPDSRGQDLHPAARRSSDKQRRP